MRTIASKSLRARYLVMALLLIGALLVIAFMGDHDVNANRHRATYSLAQRTAFLEKSRDIRIYLLAAYRNLNSYLLEPDNKNFKTTSLEQLHQSIKVSNLLLLSSYDQTADINNVVKDITAQLQSLLQQTESLYAIRENVQLLYPTFAIGNIELQPSRQKINNSFAIVFSSFNDAQIRRDQNEVFLHFVKLRDLWRVTLSTFRLYLANRAGTFNKDAFQTQENAIGTLYAEMQVVIEHLLKIDQAKGLEFEISDALEEISKTIKVWHAGYLKIVKINHSDEWRMDAVHMKEKISPLIELLSSLLSKLDGNINNIAAGSLVELDQTAARQSNLLWSIVVLGSIFLLLMLFSIENRLLKPIAMLTRALRSQAFGKEITELPNASYRETTNLIDAFSEMRHQIQMRQMDLEYQATHDGLTSLPNRLLLDDRIEFSINYSIRNKAQFSLLLIDLDSFKEVNDTLGHHVGDAVLQEISVRLKKVLREIDTVARLGGDEFAILIQDCNEQGAVSIVEKIQQSLEQTVDVNELKLCVSASIGIVVYPQHGTDDHTLLRHADIAMYRAKHNHMDYSIYDEKDDDHSLQRLTLIGELKQSLDQHGLELHYQPKLDLAALNLNSVEALLRWRHPVYGDIPPEDLIELAEQSGMISQLTGWILDTAIHQCAIWRRKDINLNVSVNLSVHSLKDEALIKQVKSGLARHRLEARHLCLEITESSMMANSAHAIEILQTLNKLGVSLAIDDFGTGFSSLAYLKQMPVNELKIDKSFVINMAQDIDDEVIVKSTIDLAHNLGMKVTAEGIETELVWKKLVKTGCDYGQGYFISKAMSSDNLEAWLNSYSDNNLVNIPGSN